MATWIRLQKTTRRAASCVSTTTRDGASTYLAKPAAGHIDAQTATPKLSTAHGLLYIYDRDTTEADYHDWQLTALDFRTGWRVFSIKGRFTETGFADNVSRILERRTLGPQYYGRKVFNNLWGTFSFGPQNSIFLGTYRGYVRISSASALE